MNGEELRTPTEVEAWVLQTLKDLAASQNEDCGNCTVLHIPLPMQLQELLVLDENGIEFYISAKVMTEWGEVGVLTAVGNVVEGDAKVAWGKMAA